MLQRLLATLVSQFFVQRLFVLSGWQEQYVADLVIPFEWQAGADLDTRDSHSGCASLHLMAAEARCSRDAYRGSDSGTCRVVARVGTRAEWALYEVDMFMLMGLKPRV
ncbi:unnamed protein product [Durusdinium trenchii]|uniref:Uncharacterized protein n=1 Tax=Durusdinium trenchii TaxID=1381693 RepID=A0ABP0LNP9_9DINO